MTQTPLGDIAIVLHSHMPYVEGFGTYPFGEEWLFDAVIRSYLPVLEVARDLTMTITPVLADQLESAATAKRLIDFTRSYRVESMELDAIDVEPDLRPACEAEGRRYSDGLARLEAVGGDVLSLFKAASERGRVELITSAATHAVLPLLASRAGLRLQLETGIRSHRRRFGHSAGFWLPECGYAPNLESALADEGIEYFCVDQSKHEDPLAALRPIAAGNLTAFPIDWEAISWLWAFDGYPSLGIYADFHRKSLRGARPWSIDGGAYDPLRGEEAARRHAREFADAVAARLADHRERAGLPGLVVFAIDTELLGHWWWEGPIWLSEVLDALPARGVATIKLAEAAARHPPQRRPLHAGTWGDEKDFRNWDSPPVADLARGVRRLELRLLREVSSRRHSRAALERAARELLAAQASDWAFLDYRRQAGDYAFGRALDHAGAMYEALDSGGAVNPRLRCLAPDMRLAPLLEP